MADRPPSFTAIIAASARAVHLLVDQEPERTDADGGDRRHFALSSSISRRWSCRIETGSFDNQAEPDRTLAGLVDESWMDLVGVLFGIGKRCCRRIPRSSRVIGLRVYVIGFAICNVDHTID